MISVVILNYNGMRYLERCLSSLFAQTYSDFEAILVDNGSSDGSIEFVGSHFPKARIVRNESNLGFAGGMNAGIACARGDYILTLNNDTFLNDGFLEHIAEPMDSDSKVGMCASKMLFPDGRINSTGICLSRSGAAWDRGIFETDNGQYDAVEEVFGPCAGAALYRKKMLDEIGLFDEDFFLYMEDVDLSFRARLSGWKCIYTFKAVVYHLWGGTAGVGSDLSVYYGNRNIIWYVLKDYPMGFLASSLPWIIGRSIAAIPHYALKGQGLVILRSDIDALKGVPRMLKKRNQISRKAPEGDILKYISTLFRIPGR